MLLIMWTFVLFIYKIIFEILRRMKVTCDANQTATDATIYSSSLTFCLLIETQKEKWDKCTKVFHSTQAICQLSPSWKQLASFVFFQ
jgi:hypothetical protein